MKFRSRSTQIYGVVAPVILLMTVGLGSTSLPALGQTAIPEQVSEAAMTLEQRRNFKMLDSSILLLLVKLARFNTTFQQNANVRWRSRSLLYPLAQEAGTACSIANTIVDLQQRSLGLNNPDLISSSVRKRGLASATVGSAIGGTSSALELVQNGLVCALAAKKGLSPRASLNTVKSFRASVDDALLERAKLIGELPASQQKGLRQLESLIFMRLRNQLFREFKRVSADSRGRMWRENTFYALDATQEFLTVGSNIVSFQTFSNSNLGGKAAVLGLVAKGISTVNPLVRTIVGKIVINRQRKKIARELAEPHVSRANDLISDWGDSDGVVAAAANMGSSDRQIEQLVLLMNNSLRTDRLIDKQGAELERLQRVATQQAISGPAIGLLAVSEKIMGVIAFYDYRDNELTSNRIKFASRIPQLVGQSYSLINTPATQVASFIKTRKLRKEGKLQSQVLEARLQHLDEIETQVRGWIVR